MREKQFPLEADVDNQVEYSPEDQQNFESIEIIFDDSENKKSTPPNKPN